MVRFNSAATLPPGPRSPAAIQTIGWWTRPIPYFEQCRRRYGSRFTMKLLASPPFVHITDPGEIRRSLMKPYLIGRTGDELRERAAQVARVTDRLGTGGADEVLAAARQRWFVGTPEEIAGQMRPFAEAGVELFMLQHLLLDDRDALELLARQVAPALADAGARR